MMVVYDYSVLFPIVTTDFAGASERLASYSHPHATVPANSKALADGIEKILFR